MDNKVFFNSGYIEFLEQLNAHNDKSWFQDNKKWYELAVREPFKKLLNDLLPEIQQLDPEILMDSKDALFRINRDLRFSKYKLPYKAHMAAGFSRGGRKSQFAGYYIQIGRKITAIGGGLPYLDREVLRKIRIEIGYKPDKFNEIINNTDFINLYGHPLGEKDADLPKSFSGISEQNPIISYKQIYYSAFYRTNDIIFNKDLISFIIKHFKAGTPLNNFLINAIANFHMPISKVSHRKVMEF